jgi:hypothetical protein
VEAAPGAAAEREIGLTEVFKHGLALLAADAIPLAMTHRIDIFDPLIDAGCATTELAALRDEVLDKQS